MDYAWWGMTCWNGLSADQQRRLIEVGNLPIDYRPEGECPNGAELCIETMHDKAPGPRFYCRPCAIVYLQAEVQERTMLPERAVDKESTG